ncbi:MAG: glutathione S-transferase family protein [Steroidobacteraceae bacterium]
MSAYQLYIANKNYSSWSLRPWVLMQQLGVAFTERLQSFAAGSNWEAFRRFAPNGRVPCLIDGAVVVWDSLAIAEYLAERHAGVWPADPVARAYARSAAAEMHSGFPALRNHCPMNCGVRVRLNGMPVSVQHELRRIDELWSDGLRRFGGPFLAGAQFTAADAFYCPVAFRVRSYQLPLSAAAGAYAQRLLQLPAMQRWESEALLEPWREAEHEKETLMVGELIEDRRV